MCTPLATATDSLILFVSFASGCQCIRGCSDFVCSFDLHCIIVLTCMIASPLLPTMGTSSCHSLHLPISLCCYCVVALYWLVFLPCIIALYCVFAYTPQSTVSTGFYFFSSSTCLLVLFLLQEERFICIAIVYYYLHVATDIDICCWYFVCFHNCWRQSPLPSPL